MEYLEEDVKWLLNLAKNSIVNELNGAISPFKPVNIPQIWKNKQALFVVLKEDGYVRGCAGSLKVTDEIWQEVINRSIEGAFYDMRFVPPVLEELPDITYEVHLLSNFKLVKFEELHKKLKTDLGLTAKYYEQEVTFLPLLWKEFPEKSEFIEAFCQSLIGKDSCEGIDTKDDIFSTFTTQVLL